MQIQELIFNTKKQTVTVYESHNHTIVFQYENIPTVRMLGGYYEVLQDEAGIKYPVLRVPISFTNMIIERK